MRTNDTVVAGCDPHKRTMTVAIVDGNGATIDVRSFPNTPAGLDRRRRLVRGAGRSGRASRGRGIGGVGSASDDGVDTGRA